MSHFEKYRAELKEQGLGSKEDLTRLVQPLLRTTTRIAVQSPMRPREDAQLRSHFGGTPYFEKGESWPVSENGSPLDFIFQVVNDGTLQLPAHIQVLQFYYDWRLNPWNTEDPGWLVKTYPAIDPEKQVRLDKPAVLPRAKYCEIKFAPQQTLPDWQSLSDFQYDAQKLSCVLNEEEPWEPYETVTKAMEAEPQYQSQLGGYAKWLQGFDPPENDNMELLFQLDSEVNADIAFGDQGLIYVFYDPTQPGEYALRLQCL